MFYKCRLYISHQPISVFDLIVFNRILSATNDKILSTCLGLTTNQFYKPINNNTFVSKQCVINKCQYTLNIRYTTENL